MGAFFASDDGGEDLKFGSFGQFHDPIAHSIDGLGGNGAIANGTVGFAGPPEEQSQVIVNFGHRPHGGTGVVGGGFLVDGNRRTQTFDGFDVGFVELSEELAGVGAEGFDVATLSLGKDGIESQGGFARTRHAGKNN